jgi:hypothetical protein
MGVLATIGKRLADEPPLANAPETANIPNVGRVALGQNSDIIRSAENYARESGIPLTSPIEYAKLDPKFARMYADYYERMRHNPNDPRTKQAYEALAKETEAQFEQMLSDGINPYLFTNNDPYKNSPYEALGDIYQNTRLGIYSTRDGFGSDNEFDPTGNPLLQEMDFTVDGQRFLLNDAFRGVHDYYGHGKHGFGFRAGGEDNAFRAHSGMFSDLARQAIATETRGQNSLLNYGPDGERNRNASLENTVFSDQKTGLLPNLVSTHRTPIGDERRRRIDADGPDGLRGRLEGAVDEDGVVEAVHYSNRPIDYLDPSRYGSGLSGRTVSEKNMAASPDFYGRTFAGLNTSERPYQKEQGIGSVPNKVQLPIEQVYDILKDPDNIKPAVYSEIPSSNPYGRYTELTKKIYDAGYSAVFQDTPMGKILAIVDPVKTGKTLATVSVSALGTAAVLAPQESQAGVKGSLFDMSKLDEVPDVPQFPLERYEPKRGMPESLPPLLTNETAKRLEGYAIDGENAGGRGWYNLEPLREKFIEEHGAEEGTKIFNSYVDKVAATSPRSNVAMNIRRASHLDILDRQGQPFGGLTNADMPKGYGHIAHTTHDHSLRDLQENGTFAALNRPKTSSFAENLKGNQTPLTADTHNFAAIKNNMEKKSPSNTQYKYIEDFQSDIASKMGMTPAQFQASVWMGAGTGVADARPFMQVFDEVVANTAERNGVTKKKALSDFIKGEKALYDLGPVMLAGGLAANYLAYSENNQPSGAERFADGVLGGADFMANMGSALTAPFVQGVQHFNAMGSPTAEGRTPSLEALQAQKAELGQMLNYSPRTELGQQYSDGLKNMIGEGLRSVAPALQETHEGLYERENMNPYRTASDGLGALHEWYKSLDPKSRMHVDAGMDVSPY